VSSTTGGDSRIESGKVRAGYFGLETRADDLLVGAAIGYTDVSLRLPDEMEMEAEVTSLIPYLNRDLDADTSVWGQFGIGSGSLLVRDRQASISAETDLLWGMAAAGVRRTAFEIGDFSVSTKADGMVSFLRNDAADMLPEVVSGAHRLRLALEGSQGWTLDDGGRIDASTEFGVRFDGGDSDNGVGAEIGGRLEYTLPTGLSGWMQGRYLLAHESSDLEEWGASFGVRQGAVGGGEGLWFEWTPAWGQTVSDRNALLEDGFGSLTAADDTRRSMKLKLGYGLRGASPVPGLVASTLPSESGSAFVRRMGLWTPYVEWTQTVADDGETSYAGRYGVRLDLGLMPGGSTATVGGRSYGAKMSLGLSEGIGQDAAGAELLIRLSYEF